MKNLYLGKGAIVQFNDEEFEELETVDIKYNNEVVEGKRLYISMPEHKIPVQVVAPVDNFIEI